MTTTASKINEMIRRETFNTLGVAVDADQCEREADRLGLTETYETIRTVQISPAMCGPLAVMFSKIRCEVQAAVNEGRLYLVYNFRYEHPQGGMNGCRVEKTFPIE